MKLYTSNQKKIREFQRFGLEDIEVLSGPDLPEVKGTAEQVILYKTLAAARATNSDDLVVEDTILAEKHENGALEEIVDIRWKIKELGEKPNTPILWRTSLGYLKDGIISIFVGEVWCHVTIPETIPEDAFAFDPYLIPEGYDKTFYELNQEGRKDEISPRKKAIDHLVAGESTLTVRISELPEWQGEFQHTNMIEVPKIR